MKTQGKTQNFWLDMIPCVHRLHDPVPTRGAQSIQKALGMSLNISEFKRKTVELSEALGRAVGKGTRALLTFDDGYKDIFLALSIIEKRPEIQPVLFLTGRQLRGDTRPLPLTALYAWCADNAVEPDKLKGRLGIDRRSLKEMPENEQRKLLEACGIDSLRPSGVMVGAADVQALIRKGWLIGYHGPEHCDLRILERSELEQIIMQDVLLLQGDGYVPWIAWPEGRWDNQLSLLADLAGIEMQFGLVAENRVGTKAGVLQREIWK